MFPVAWVDITVGAMDLSQGPPRYQDQGRWEPELSHLSERIGIESENLSQSCIFQDPKNCTCMHAYVHTHTHLTHVCTAHTCMYLSTHCPNEHKYTYTYVPAHAHAHECSCVHAHTTHTCMYISMHCPNKHMHTYTYVHAHACTHVHTLLTHACT